MKFEGIMPALLTPLNSDNKTVNESAARQLIDLLLNQGANGFYILGGTGEGLVMSAEDRKEMCEIVVDHVKGRKPVINHIAAVNLNEAVDLAKHAEKTGADAIAGIPPVFFAYSEDDLYNYYKKLASNVNIPLIIYYHPGAQKKMSAELIARIFEIDNVTGVKWSSPDLFELMKLKDITNGQMNIINGPDELLISGLSAGADAGIGSTYNVMLPDYVKLYDFFKKGDIPSAQQTQYKVNRVINVICKYGVIPAVKQMAEFMGINAGNATYPMTHYTDIQKERFRKELKEAGWDCCDFKM